MNQPHRPPPAPPPSATEPQTLRQLDVFGLLGRVLAPFAGRFAPVVVDGGAHEGDVTRVLAARFPGCVVHAFEPGEAAHDKLRAVAAEAPGGRILAHPVALAEEEGEASFYENVDDMTSALLKANGRAVLHHGAASITIRERRVRVRRLDAWAREAGVAGALLLKLDIQGVEEPALRGADAWLDGVAAVMTEVQLTAEYEGASTFGGVDGLLRERGFVLYQLVRLHLLGPHRSPGFGDGIWLRREVRDEVERQPLPPELELTPEAALRDTLAQLAERGHRRIVLAPSPGWSPRQLAVLAEATAETSLACSEDALRAACRAGVTGVVAASPGEMEPAAAVVAAGGAVGSVEMAWVADDPSSSRARLHGAVPAGIRDALPRAARALAELHAAGVRRFAVYGAGRHTRKIAGVLAAGPPRPVALVEDRPGPGPVPGLPAGLADLPRLTPADLLATLGSPDAAEAVVLSSDAFEPALWEKTAHFRAAGLRVVRLYADR